ncbi:MAG: serine protease [Erysipelotrichaceae bacterium]|nr:serine protease [Erysipelotrichaceae bacterium]
MSKNNRLIYVLIFILIAWLLILSFRPSGSVSRQEIINEYTVSGFSTDFTKVVEDNSSSVVSVNADGAVLSGIIYQQDKEKVYVLSAYHGIEDAGNISVILGSTYTIDAELVGYDVFTDLAVLQLECPYQVAPVRMGDATKLKKGEFVICIGTPVSLDYAGSVQLGMIADERLTVENSISLNYETHEYYLDVIELSSALIPGYSGGPIMNMNGEVVGMNTMALDDGISFAMTANEIKIVADRIIASQELVKNSFEIKGTYIKEMPNYEKANLNLDIQTISGLYAHKVLDGSLAAAAGVRPGDVVLKINDVALEGLNSYLQVSYLPAETYIFEVLRNGETQLLSIENND